MADAGRDRGTDRFAKAAHRMGGWSSADTVAATIMRDAARNIVTEGMAIRKVARTVARREVLLRLRRATELHAGSQVTRVAVIAVMPSASCAPTKMKQASYVARQWFPRFHVTLLDRLDNDFITIRPFIMTMSSATPSLQIRADPALIECGGTRNNSGTCSWNATG